jgi:hypothetical protein
LAEFVESTAVTVYPVMVAFPLVLGIPQLTEPAVLPATATTLCGAEAVPKTEMELLLTELGPVPAALVAVTLK